MKHFTTQPCRMLRWSALRWSAPLLSLTLLLTLGLATGQAQMKVQPGVMDTCYASPEIMNTKVRAEHSFAEMQLLRRSAEARMAAPAAADEVPPVKTAEFIVEYNGFTPEAQAAFQYAVDIWSTIVVSDVPIRVEANFIALPPGVLGSAGPRFIFSDFDESVRPDTWYVSALADAIAGEDLAETVDSVANAPDIGANFSNVFNWYYGTDLNPASDQYDFVSVVLHELGHGLGFTGFASVDDSTNEGSVRLAGLPVIYSDFVKDGFRTPILTVPDPSTKLAAFLTGRNDLFMTGKNAVAAYGGGKPQLYTPAVWTPGSSYSHWDEAAFPAGDSNSLMSPQFGFAESIHQVGAITKGLFKDMGWTINEAPVALISLRQTVKVSPGEACLGPVPITDEVGVLPGSTVCFYYTVTNVGDVPLMLHSLKDSQSGDILIEVEQILAPGASLTVTRQDRIKKSELPLTNVATWTASTPGEVGEVSATAVAKLFFAPIAQVQPKTTVNVTLKSGERKIRPLRIANRGGTDLTYTAVIRETSTSFAEQVKASQQAVAQLSSPAASSLVAWSPQQGASDFDPIPYDGEALKAVQFATDFESFDVGPLGVQNGWVATDTLAQISESNPFSGSKHLQLLSDSTLEEQYSVFSPLIKGGAEPYSSFSLKLNFTKGAQYRIFPSQEISGQLSIGGAVLIAPGGEVLVFVSGSGYTNTGYVLPERYVDLKYVSSKVDETYDLYIDDELVADDVVSFSTDVDLVEFRYYGGATGAALNIDDIELIDGDAAAPDWVQVEPTAGTVPSRSRLNADIVFEGRGLEPGVYTADITIMTNDPFNPSAVIPVKLTVVGKPSGIEPLNLVAVCSENPSEQLRWQIVNPNRSEVEVTWSVVGTAQQGTMMAAAGESFFYTQPNGSSNRVAIEWQTGDGKTMRQVKAASTATCDEPSVATRLELYPVPVSETLTVGLTGAANTAGTLSIYDQVSGEKVFQEKMTMTGQPTMIKLSTSEVGLKSSGTYVMSFETAEKALTKRFVVE